MRLAMLLILIAALLPATAPAEADFILLNANFDDKTIDAPIGTGGPEVGEPIDVGSQVDAIVRWSPFTPVLQIIHTHETSTGFVTFEFVGGASVDVGNVTATLDMVIPEAGFFKIRFLPAGEWGPDFCNLYTAANGNIYLTDNAGFAGVLGSYSVDVMFQIQVVFDTEADTYSIWWDGDPLITDRSHGIVGTGIGRFVAGIDSQAGLDDDFIVDSIHITADEYTPAGDASLSEVKALY